MSLLTAIATATAFAVFGFPFRHYQCWFSFSKAGTAAGSALYLAVAGAGGGVLGWGAATLSDIAPTPNAALNGLVYGAVGALGLRADFAAKPRPDAAPDQTGPARSALRTSINWTAALLDDITYRRAEGWLIGLTDTRLCREALRIQADIVHQPDKLVPDKAKNEMLAQLVRPMEELTSSTRRTAARANLVTFCARYYVERHLPKTPRSARA